MRGTAACRSCGLGRNREVAGAICPAFQRRERERVDIRRSGDAHRWQRPGHPEYPRLHWRTEWLPRGGAVLSVKDPQVRRFVLSCLLSLYKGPEPLFYMRVGG